MKKFLSFILVLMFMVSVSVFAAPSITVEDLTSVTGYLTSTGMAVDSDFAVNIADENAASTLIKSELEKFLNENIEFTITAFFPMEAYETIVSAFPPDVNIDTLTVDEVVPISFDNYKMDYGSLTITFDFPTKHTEDESVIVLVGVLNPVTNEVEWISLPVFVTLDNEVEVIFSQEAVEKIAANDAVLLVLSD